MSSKSKLPTSQPGPLATPDDATPQATLNSIYGYCDEALGAAIEGMGADGDPERAIECLRCLRRALEYTADLAAALHLAPPVKP